MPLYSLLGLNIFGMDWLLFLPPPYLQICVFLFLEAAVSASKLGGKVHVVHMCRVPPEGTYVIEGQLVGPPGVACMSTPEHGWQTFADRVSVARAVFSHGTRLG